MTNITKKSYKSNEKNKLPHLNKYNYRELKKIYTILCKEEPAFQITQEYFFRWSAKFSKLHMSQSTIARELGLSRETVNRVIRRMREYGFLYVWYRPNNTCYYQLASFWFTLRARKLFGEMFPILALGFQFIFCLLSSPSKEVSASECHTNRIISSSPSLFIYNNTNNQHRRVTNEEINNTSKKKHEVKTKEKVSRMLQVVTEALKLSDNQQSQLQEYDDKILAEAMTRYRKQTGEILSPFRFFVGICKHVQMERNTKRLSGNNAVDIPRSVGGFVGKKRTEERKVEAPTPSNYLNAQGRAMSKKEHGQLQEKVKRYDKIIANAEQSYEKYPTTANRNYYEHWVRIRENLVNLLNNSFFVDESEEEIPTTGKAESYNPIIVHSLAESIGAAMPDKAKEEILLKMTVNPSLLNDNPVMYKIMQDFLRSRSTNYPRSAITDKT